MTCLQAVPPRSTWFSLDEARARLDALYAKQGRLNRFRTRAERDAFLNGELASLRDYQRTQAANLESATRELASTRETIRELAGRTEGVQGRLEDRREKARQLAEELAEVKEEHGKLVEQRKELWREDARLTNTVGHAENELRSAERNLASMMDKVSLLLVLTGRRVDDGLGYWERLACRRQDR